MLINTGYFGQDRVTLYSFENPKEFCAFHFQDKIQANMSHLHKFV